MTRKLGFSKLRSERTFIMISFSLQHNFLLEDHDWWQFGALWRKSMFWARSKSFSASESFDQRSAPQTAKKPFSLKSHFTRWLLPLWRGSQLDTELILSWYYLTISWHKTALRRRPACGGWWRWHWNTRLCMIVIMVRGNLTLLLRKPQLLAP